MKLMGRIILPSFVHPFVKLFCACHILRTLQARVLKFYIWVPNEKIADPCFFLAQQVCLELCPFEKVRIKFCEQDISKSI